MVGLEALRKSDLFEGLDDSELKEIAKMAQDGASKRGRLVDVGGDFGDSLTHHGSWWGAEPPV